MVAFPTTAIRVASSSDPSVLYTVTITSATEASCTCPAAEHRPGPCKHARAVLEELAGVLPQIPELAEHADSAGATPPGDARPPAAGPPRAGEASPNDPPTADEWIAAHKAIAADPEDPTARQTLRALEWRERMYAKANPAEDPERIRALVVKVLGRHGQYVTEELAEAVRLVGLPVVPPTIREWRAAERERDDAEAAWERRPPSSSMIRSAYRGRQLGARDALLELRARAEAWRLHGGTAAGLEERREVLHGLEAQRRADHARNATNAAEAAA